MKHDHHVTEAEAREYIERREARLSGVQVHGGAVVASPSATDQRGGVYKGGTFDRAIIDEILAQPGCEGLRIYRGDRVDGAPTHVLVGVDGNGEDMTAVIAEIERPCPPFCAPSGVLGSGA